MDKQQIQVSFIGMEPTEALKKYILEKLFKKEKFNWNWLGIGLIPLGLLSVFGLYQVQMKDFWAYFHTGGVVPMPYPFSVFNSHARWVGTAWVEEALLYFFIYLLTVVNLSVIKERSFFYFSLFFFTATVFVQHMDIARYSLPLWPLAAIAFEKLFTSKKFLLALLILLPAIYLFSWNLLIENIMHVGDWKPFL
jgi:hypothetical protein